MQVTQSTRHSVMNMMAENVTKMTENGAIIALTIAHELKPRKIGVWLWQMDKI